MALAPGLHLLGAFGVCGHADLGVHPNSTIRWLWGLEHVTSPL